MSKLLEHIIRKLLFEQLTDEEREQDFDKRFSSSELGETSAITQMFYGTSKQKAAAIAAGAEALFMLKITYASDNIPNPERLYDIIDDAIAIENPELFANYADKNWIIVVGNISNTNEQWVPILIYSITTLETTQNKSGETRNQKQARKKIELKQTLLIDRSYNTLTNDEINNFIKFLWDNQSKYGPVIFNNLKQIDPSIDQAFDTIRYSLRDVVNQATTIDDFKQSTVRVGDQDFKILQFLWEPDRINTSINNDIRTKYAEFVHSPKTTSVLSAVNLKRGVFRNKLSGGAMILDFNSFNNIVTDTNMLTDKQKQAVNKLMISKVGYQTSAIAELKSLWSINVAIQQKDPLYLDILKKLGLPNTPVSINIDPNSTKFKKYMYSKALWSTLERYNKLTPEQKKNLYSSLFLYFDINTLYKPTNFDRWDELEKFNTFISNS